MRGWDIFLPGRHWIYEPQVEYFSNDPVELGLPHRAGRSRPGRSPVSSLVCKSCTCIGIFLSGHGTLSSPGGAGSCWLLWLLEKASSLWHGFGDRIGQ